MEYNTAAQGTEDATRDCAEGWCVAGELTEPQLRDHIWSMVRGSNAYTDAYVAAYFSLA